MNAQQTAVAEKPSLHEIAAMPLSEGQAAMRKFYDPNWGTEAVPGSKFRVKGQITLTVDIDETFEADNKEDALELAEQWAKDHAHTGDVDDRDAVASAVNECEVAA